MFKTDKKSLEELSFRFNEIEIANLRKLIEMVSKHNLNSASIKELARLTKGLDEIGRLKLDGKVYAFDVEDNYASRRGSGDGDSEGIELYLRQGDRLEEYMVPSSRDFCYQYDTILAGLKKKGIGRIYTGEFNESESFLGIDRIVDADDPLIRSPLDESHVNCFRIDGIEVIVLDSLI